MAYARLELHLRHIGGGYGAEARFRLQPSAADTILTTISDPCITFDLDLLTALSLDPEGYGRQLWGMLFADQRLCTAFVSARAQAEAQRCPLRLCVRLDVDDAAAHALRWETLSDPESGGRLALQERVLLSRYIDSPDLAPVIRPARGDLRALAAVANPAGLERYGLSPLNVRAELARIRRALHPIPLATVTGTDGRHEASLPGILAALHEGPDIFLLMCHGSTHEGESYLWLENDAGGLERVRGADLAEGVAGLSSRPVLTLLVACRGASSERFQGALAAAGPRLARAGLPAVLAMQGEISLTTAAKFMPALFRELQRDGQIDRAVAAARATVGDRPDWWAPALFLRLDDGCIWAGEQPPAPPIERAVNADNRVASFVNEGVIQGSVTLFNN
ncbi:MAG: CHAT domain-containing protein [Chloroflexales bacterium]|nr:CHAT domain-containing protein [Chloroflexales bacterium]